MYTGDDDLQMLPAVVRPEHALERSRAHPLLVVVEVLDVERGVCPRADPALRVRHGDLEADWLEPLAHAVGPLRPREPPERTHERLVCQVRTVGLGHHLLPGQHLREPLVELNDKILEHFACALDLRRKLLLDP